MVDLKILMLLENIVESNLKEAEPYFQEKNIFLIGNEVKGVADMHR